MLGKPDDPMLSGVGGAPAMPAPTRAVTRAVRAVDPRLLAQAARAGLFVWIPLFVILGAALAFSLVSGTSIRELTQDPATVLEVPFYTGAVSSIGIVLWSAAAAICLFTPFFLPEQAGPTWGRFLIVSGLFTTVLLFDDLFLLHDEILLVYIGISGELYGVAYVLVMAVFVVRFRRLIVGSNYLLFAIALGFFGLSAVTDLGHRVLTDIFPSRYVLLVEDGSKLLGIGTWLAYFAFLTQSLLRGPGELSTPRPVRR